jgi:hypothetical protein
MAQGKSAKANNQHVVLGLIFLKYISDSSEAAPRKTHRGQTSALQWSEGRARDPKIQMRQRPIAFENAARNR